MELEHVLDIRPAPYWLTRKQAADLLGVTEGTLRHWARRVPRRARQQVPRPPFEKIGGRYYYPTADLLKFVIAYRPHPYRRKP